MKIKRSFSLVLCIILWTVSAVSCSHSGENKAQHYVFLDLATLYGSCNGEECQDVIRNASFGEKVELIEQFNEYSKVKVEGKEVYISTAALMNEDSFDILRNAFGANENLKQDVYTPQGREALVAALQGHSTQSSIVASRPSPYDDYFIHYAFDITDRDNHNREYILFGVNDLETPPVKLCSLPIPMDKNITEDIVYRNGEYIIR